MEVKDGEIKATNKDKQQLVVEDKDGEIKLVNKLDRQQLVVVEDHGEIKVTNKDRQLVVEDKGFRIINN